MSEELTAPEQQMLDRVFTHGIGLPELGSQDVLDSLAERHYLGQAPLYGNRTYYYLDKRTFEEFDCPENEIGPLKEPEKIRRFAMLSFCVAQQTPHRPLTQATFVEHFPELFEWNQSRCRNFYLTPQRLGYLRVDVAPGGAYWRVTSRIRNHIAALKRMPPFAELIARGAMEFALVTAFATKAQRLRNDNEKREADAPIVVHLVPTLRELIAPPKIN